MTNSEIAALEWRVVERAISWRDSLTEAEKAVICGLNYDTTSDHLLNAVDALIAAREKEQNENTKTD